MHICGIGIEKWECVLLFANSLVINILSYWEKSYLVDSRPFWRNLLNHCLIAVKIIGDSLRNQAPTHISNIFSRWHCDRLHSGLMVGPPLPWLHNYWYIRFWRKLFWMGGCLTISATLPHTLANQYAFWCNVNFCGALFCVCDWCMLYAQLYLASDKQGVTVAKRVSCTRQLIF